MLKDKKEFPSFQSFLSHISCLTMKYVIEDVLRNVILSTAIKSVRERESGTKRKKGRMHLEFNECPITN